MALYILSKKEEENDKLLFIFAITNACLGI